MIQDRQTCTCHDIPIETFRAAVSNGAHNVKTCFRSIGCLPKCNNCIPMVRSVLAELQTAETPAQTPVAIPATSPNASTQRGIR
jgi:bacterioferritin-associated ferredoxin